MIVVDMRGRRYRPGRATSCRRQTDRVTRPPRAARREHIRSRGGIPTRTNDAAAPRTGGRAGPRRSRLRVPRTHRGNRPGACETSPRPTSAARSRPLRAQRLRRGAGQAADRPRSRDAALVFGRIDRMAETPDADGGLPHRAPAVADEQSEPIVVDWRAPVAEPFYRATGREPMGLVRGAATSRSRDARARHRGRAVRRRPPGRRPRRRARPGRARGAVPSCAATRRCSPPSSAAARARSATSSPRSRPSRTRSSAPRRPVCSSSRAARAPARRSSPSTAPPTSCTPTASRSRTRACSSSGRTAVFLRYIERVLPSLGEAGVEQVVLPIWCPTSTGPAGDPGRQRPGARVKGDARMSDVIDKAVRDRERALRRTCGCRSAPGTCG